MSIPLIELISPAGQRAAGRVDLPVYSVTKHRGFVPSLEYFKKQVFGKDLASYKVVERGQFAYATIHLDEGSIGIAPEASLVSPMYTVFETDSSKIDSSYLLYFLKSPTALAQYSRLGNGTAERRKSISLAALGRLDVPFPPLAEQRRIAAILDHADALRTTAHNQLATLAQLLDAIVPRSGGQRLSLRAAGVGFSSGKSVTGSGTNEHRSHRVLKVSAVSSGQFEPAESKPLPADYAPAPGHLARDGDLLMTRASGSPDLIGVTAFVENVGPSTYLPDKLWRVELSDDAAVRPEYLDAVTRRSDFRAFIRHESSGASGVRNISQSKLLKFTHPIPSLAKQDDFIAGRAQIMCRRDKMQARAEMLDSLFASLRHRAFGGGL